MIRKNVIVVKMLPEDMTRYFEVYKSQLIQNPSVIATSRSERVVGEPWPFSSIRTTDDDPEDTKRVFFNLADYGFFETMGISIISGRGFSKEYATDSLESVILNEEAVDILGLEDPIGSQVHFFSFEGPRTVVGVVKNFNYTSLHEEIGPAAIILPFINMEHMYIRFQPGRLQDQVKIMEEAWDQVASDTPLDWKFLDENLAQLYHTEKKLSQMIQIFSVLAILLACLGLYGVLAFMINNRIKEFGIRKVLGATVLSLYSLFAKTYIYQLVIAMIIILPVIHYFLNQWLDNFAYHIDIGWWIYPLSMVLMMIITLITITYRTLKAAKTNPTGLLRSE